MVYSFKDVEILTNDYFVDVFPDRKTDNKKIHQRLFFIEGLSNSESKLSNATQDTQMHIVRCEKCGFPIHIKPIKQRLEASEQKPSEDNLQSNMKRECSICSRTKILNAVLISSYIISIAIFALLIIGAIFDVVGLDLGLMIGCLEIIFLLFFGRFLEEAVFFGYSPEEKLLAALYRFAESGEIQALDIAMKYIEKNKTEVISDEFFQGILHILSYQALSVPYYFQKELSKNLRLSTDEFDSKLSSIIDEESEIPYLKNMIHKVPPSGITIFTDISVKTNNEVALNEIFKRIETEINQETIDTEFIKELYINQDLYKKAYSTFGEEQSLSRIIELLSNFKAPRVPSIDVVEGSRKILQHPFMRYIIRIFLYIALAFLLGFLYQLLD
jgi:hypothetical protein